MRQFTSQGQLLLFPLLCWSILLPSHAFVSSAPTVYTVNHTLALPLSYPYRGTGMAFTAGLDSTNADLVYVTPHDSDDRPLIHRFNTSTAPGHLLSPLTFVDAVGQQKFGFDKPPINGRLAAMTGSRLVMWDQANAGVVVLSAETGRWEFAFKGQGTTSYCRSMAVDSASETLVFASGQLYLFSLSTGAVLSSASVPYRDFSGPYGLVFDVLTRHFLVVLTAAIPPSHVAEFDASLALLRNVSLPGGDLPYAITVDQWGSWVILYFGMNYPHGYICSVDATAGSVSTACNKEVELSSGSRQLTRRLDGTLIALVLQQFSKRNATLEVYFPTHTTQPQRRSASESTV